jgi:hypothetical protein
VAVVAQKWSQGGTFTTEAWRLKIELWRVCRPVDARFGTGITLMRSRIRIRIGIKVKKRIRFHTAVKRGIRTRIRCRHNQVNTNSIRAYKGINKIKMSHEKLTTYKVLS